MRLSWFAAFPLLIGSLAPGAVHAAPAAKPAARPTQPSRAAPPPKATSPAKTTPAETAHLLAIDVRSAPVGNVVAQVGVAGESPMRVAPEIADARVTLYAPRTSPEELRHTVATLFGHRWRSTGKAPATTWVLERDPAFTARAVALERQQRTHFLRRLQETAAAMGSGSGEETAAQVRATYQKRHPEIDAEVLKDLNAEFLRQSLLVLPLTLPLQQQLVRSGSVSIPFYMLRPGHQELLARFADVGGLRAALGLPPGAGDVTAPYSRATYRLLYGDRWTDDMLWIQVGAPGNWATAILPSILFREQDASDLYPQVKERPNDAGVWQRTPGRFDVAGKSWDRILAELAAAMNLKVASDAYIRPSVFDPRPPAEAVAGVPLRMALDRLTQDRGLFWWKERDWYYFRSRTWIEEEQVAVPDRLLLGWTRDVRQLGRLTGADLEQMGALTEEQLLTLNLMASAPNQAPPHLSLFDPNNASLAATSLLLFRSLTPAQREQALSTAGLPALWMSPFQQNLYSALAMQEGYLLLPEEADTWGFAVEQAWSARAPNQPVTGRVRWRWSFGPGLEEGTEVNVSDALLTPSGSSEPGSSRR